MRDFHKGILLVLMPGCLLHAEPSAAQMSGEPLFGAFISERLERLNNDSLDWDMQGWYGGDYHKLWVKTEGTTRPGAADKAELQLLYSYASSAFMDLQIGWRHDDLPDGSRNSLALGILGDAPYRIEYDSALFLTEHGDLLFRGEFERDLLLTQRWVLQPRVELEGALTNSASRRIESGLNELHAGLRLRYEISRRFAPYAGIEWRRDNIEETSGTEALIGLRFWF